MIYIKKAQGGKLVVNLGIDSKKVLLAKQAKKSMEMR